MSTVQKEPPSLASMDVNPLSRRTELIAVQVSMTAIALLIVSLRLISRYMILKSPGWDDFAITAAMILAIIQAPLVLSCLNHGGGAHYSDIQPTEALYVMKVIYASRVIYLLIVTAIKFSILFFYLRLSPPATFHRWVKTTMVACGVEGVLFISMALFQCTPVQSFWNSAVPGHCISILAFFRAETAFNLVTNVAIILLPMPMVWRLHMALRRKILLTGIFASGVIPCGSLIARLVNIHNSEEALIAGRYEPTWIVVSLQDWEAVEYCTALICASLIHLNPLARIIATTILESIHATSTPRGITERRIPAYFLNAGVSSRYHPIGVGRHEFSVFSAFRWVKGIKPRVRFRARMDAGTDAPGRASYEALLQRPQRALIRGWKSL